MLVGLWSLSLSLGLAELENCGTNCVARATRQPAWEWCEKILSIFYYFQLAAAASSGHSLRAAKSCADLQRSLTQPPDRRPFCQLPLTGLCVVSVAGLWLLPSGLWRRLLSAGSCAPPPPLHCSLHLPVQPHRHGRLWAASLPLPVCRCQSATASPPQSVRRCQSATVSPQSVRCSQSGASPQSVRTQSNGAPLQTVCGGHTHESRAALLPGQCARSANLS